jgi:hypothetical protein
VSYLLVDRSAYTPEYLQNNAWIVQTQPEATIAYTNLTSGNTPIVAQAMGRCQALSSARYILLDATCLARYAGG